MLRKNQGEAESTRLERMERWFRNQPILSVLILRAAALVGISETASKGSDLMILLGLKQEKTLQLASESAKGELSRNLTRLAWSRLFWTQNYIARLTAHRPPAELDYTWNKHLDTDAAWSSEFMLNLNGLEKFYPNSQKAIEFQKVHDEFVELDDKHLVPLRFAEGDGKDHAADEAEAKAITDKINVDLYCFALNHDEHQNACPN